jgi:hypothetical protein
MRLARLAALSVGDTRMPKLIAILLACPGGESGSGNRGLTQLTGPDGTASLIDQLRAGGTVLAYDPAGRTLRADGHDAPSVTIGRDH